MNEVFSKTVGPNATLCDQEFYELKLYDSDDIWNPGHMVMQSRAFWSKVDQQFMWDEIETERWPTPKEAEERYAARRRALVKRGFIYSDMDF